MPIAKGNGAVATTVGEAPTVGKAEIQLGSTLQSAPLSRPLSTGRDDAPRATGNKDRRILVQGITQAVAQSPIVAGLSNYTTPKDVAGLIIEVSRLLIDFVEAETK